MDSKPKQYFLRLIRRAGWLAAAENLRAMIFSWRYASSNRRFLAEHRDVPFPPAGLMHDPYGTVDYAFYWDSGRTVAAEIKKVLDEAGGSQSGSARILEWGCGPGRVIRHLPAHWPGGNCEVHGCDYNEAPIEWCRTFLPEIIFRVNTLAPPLDYADGYFDFIYCLSVFTHLSEAMHHAWLQELLRVLKPAGCLLITLNGHDGRTKLLPDELARYDSGELVVREGFAEGRRMFTAFHGERFIRERFLKSVDILRHDLADNPIMPRQDVWLVRKRA
jgi:SAM-dependent methyltransferase